MKILLLFLFLLSSMSWGDETSAFYEAPSQSKKQIQPVYENCQDVDLSSLSLKESSLKKKTEGGFCFNCILQKFGFGEIKETVQTLQSKAFKQKLQKRVIGQIQAKIYQTQMLRACVRGDGSWFGKKKIKVDWPLMKAACKKKTKELKDSIKERWSEMRVNLALSSPAIREDRILSNKATWFDSTPSHLISDFNDLSKLSSREKVKARKLYVETLAETPLEKFSSSQFKGRMYKGKPLHLPLSGERYLTSNDKARLKQAVGDLQKKAKESYFQITSEMPVLGYLNTGNPKKKELDEAFLKIEEKLEDFLEKAKSKKADMGLLLSFKPLVEELLKEEEGYCLVAEKARIEAEENESLKNWALMGAGVVAAVPCFITGPVGVTACLAGGVALGIWGYKEAQVAAKESMGRALTGKEFETMAELNEKERDEFLEKVLFPTAFWGTTAGTARAVRGWLRGSKAVAERKKLGERSLRRALNKKQAEALERAHRVGLGEKGKDGTPARIGNYTEAQLREKARILREAGFSRAERQKLIKDGVVGLNFRTLTKEQTQEFIDVPDLTSEQVLDLRWDYLTPEQTRDLNLKSLLAKTEEDPSNRKRLIAGLQLEHLSANQVKDLPVEELSLDQVKNILGRLDETQIKKIPNEIIREPISNLPLEHLTPEQTRALDLEYYYSRYQNQNIDDKRRKKILEDIRKLNVEHLSSEQLTSQSVILRYLDSDQIQNLNVENLSYTNNDHLAIFKKLSPEQTRKLDLENMETRKMLSHVSIKDLSQKQVEQLNVSEIMESLARDKMKKEKQMEYYRKGNNPPPKTREGLDSHIQGRLRRAGININRERSSEEWFEKGRAISQNFDRFKENLQDLNVEYLTPEQMEQVDAQYLSKDQVKALLRRELRGNNPN